MHLQAAPYNNIKSGRKKVAIRINDEKRRQLRVGDKIEFILQGSVPEEKLARTVVGLHQFDTFTELFSQFPKEGDASAMYQYYPLEEEQKYGVLAIVLG